MFNITFPHHYKPINWSAIILFTLGFWLSSSFVLDFVLIPSLSVTGMMSDGDFASAGFVIFGVFNRVELICASLVLTTALVFGSQHYFTQRKQVLSIVFSLILLIIALAYTYVFTPHLTAWGLCLNQFNPSQMMPEGMISWHKGYWVLELVKYALAGTLLRWSYQGLLSHNS